jgi:integrase/recombinase XerD
MVKTELNLEFLREMYSKYKDTNEANIQSHVVVKFLEMLGYDTTEFYYEHPKYHKDGRADIAVKIDDVKYLYVEVKPADSKLGEKEKSQLAGYLIERGLSWGILTNGKSFILFNANIEPVPNSDRSVNIDRMVFNLDIFNKKDVELLKYFSKENIFIKEITNYFRDIAQFKAYKYPDGGKSWNVYKSTLFSFFSFYSENLRRYRDLKEIRLEEFEDFLHHDMASKNSKEKGRKIISVETFDNKYSHIRSFFQTLKIRSHGFDEQKVQLMRRMNITGEITVTEEMLTEDNIELILKFYNDRKDGTRNKAIVLLSLCFGLERSTILNLTLDAVKKDKLILGKRELIMPPKLQVLMSDLIDQHKKDKVKESYLFYTRYSNKFKPLSESTINYIFDTLVEIDRDNPNWKVLNPAFIRATLIKQLFINNYSIDEIVYLTGADLHSLSNLISTEEIIEQVKTRGKKPTKVHPYHKFLYY